MAGAGPDKEVAQIDVITNRQGPSVARNFVRGKLILIEIKPIPGGLGGGVWNIPK